MHKKGFTFIEVMIVITIMAVLATVIVPNLGTKKPDREREEYASRLNGFVGTVWSRAVTTGLMHRIFLDMGKKAWYVEQEDKEHSTPLETKFIPYVAQYGTSRMSWPPQYELKNFFIGTFDELAATGPRDFKVYFVIMPDGLSQEVTINLVDKADKSRGNRAREVSLVLNPFTAQFGLNNAFVQP